MTDQPDTDWIRNGARVAVYTSGYTQASVRIETVERLTATQIVLSDGGRFRRSDLEAVGSYGVRIAEDFATTYVGWGWHIEDPDDLAATK